MKVIDILRTASGNIGQSKLRSFLTVIAVFIGAFTLTLTTGIGAGISQYIDGQLGGIGADNVLIISSKTSSNPFGSSDPEKYDAEKVLTKQDTGVSLTLLTEKDIDTLRAVSGITSVLPYRSVSPSYVVGPNGQKYILSVAEYVTGTNVVMNAGVITNNDAADRQIALPVGYVSALGFANDADAVGKSVTIGIADSSGALTEVTAVVSGVPQKNLLSSTGTNINTALFDNLYNLQNAGIPATALKRYAYLVAYFDKGLTAAQVTELKRGLDTQGYTAQTFADRIAIVKQVVNGIVIVFNIFAVIALLAASFGVINTLLMSVQERTKEIGLMKAMGMGRGRIFLLFSTEAVLLGFWGSFLGACAAVGIGQVANRLATNSFLKDFEGLNLLAYPPQNLILIVVGIMAVAFLAGTLPARRASGLNPIDALRYE
jgi:putative ABC transport system permease protein